MLPVSGAWQFIASGRELVAPAAELGERGVLELGQPRLRGQEEVPQPALARLRLQLLDRPAGRVWSLRRRPARGSSSYAASAGNTSVAHEVDAARRAARRALSDGAG